MYNRAFIIGNLTRDPEVRFTTSGIPVARFTIAVNRPRRKDAGDNEVDFINIVAWRRIAEICKEYLKKGMSVAIEGRLQLREYEKNGEKKIFSEVIADNMQMLGKRSDNLSRSKDISSEGVEQKNQLSSEEVPF